MLLGAIVELMKLYGSCIFRGLSSASISDPVVLLRTFGTGRLLLSPQRRRTLANLVICPAVIQGIVIFSIAH